MTRGKILTAIVATILIAMVGWWSVQEVRCNTTASNYAAMSEARFDPYEVIDFGSMSNEQLDYQNLQLAEINDPGSQTDALALIAVQRRHDAEWLVANCGEDDIRTAMGR